MITLHELLARESRLLFLLEEAGGEVTPEIAVLMDVMAAEPVSVPQKVEGYLKVMDNLRALAEAQRGTASRIAKSAAANKKAAERVEARLKQCLADHGKKEVATAVGSVRLCKNSQPSIKWLGEDLTGCPEECLKTTHEFSPSKAADYLADGGILGDKIAIEHGFHLRID